MITTWRKELDEVLKAHDESWSDIVSNTMSDEQMDTKFDSGYGGTGGCEFTVWTHRRVYFPCQYDGAEWVGSVVRNPDGIATEHIGGG